MSDLEKINIYVPKRVELILNRDAWLFEIYKTGSMAINHNRFLSLLLIGYYDAYVEERHKALEKIKDELKSVSLSQKSVDELSERIMNQVVLPEVPKRKGKNPARLSLKPTEKTEGIITSIIKDLSQFDYISQYLCKMFLSYCQKPLFERERIIFSSSYDFLETACRTHRGITFTTIWDSKTVHEVYPYKICVGMDEMFNYLLCQEINHRTGEPEARTYRLNRLSHLKFCAKSMSLVPEVEDYLKRMQDHGAQYAINENDIVCVKLSDYGVLSYNRVYHGRPSPLKIEKKNGASYFYFDCSKLQIMHYFRRFEPGAAEIVSPEGFRNQMKSFFQKNLENYQ